MKIQKCTMVGLATMALLIALSNTLPFSFSSAHTPQAFRFRLEIEPQTEFYLYSKKFVETEDHWTRIRTFGNDITVQPSFNRENVLYNQRHEGRYHLAYHDEVSYEQGTRDSRHLHYINTKYNNEEVGILLPSFSSQVRYIRTDRLYRCSNTLVSVQWLGNDAYIVAMSLHERWKLVQNIDNGFINVERGVQYGSAVDYGHEHPVRIEVGHNGDYCSISKDTSPAQINYNWAEQSYSIEKILELVGQSLPLANKRKTYTDEL